MKREILNDPSFLREYREFRRLVVCPICLSKFTDPTILPCSHTFCENCINHAFSVKDDICPICATVACKRKIVEDPKVVHILSMISDFVDLIEPSEFNKPVINTYKYAARSPADPKLTSGVMQNSSSSSSSLMPPPVRSTVANTNTNFANNNTTFNTNTAPNAASTNSNVPLWNDNSSLSRTAPPVVTAVEEEEWRKPGILVDVLPRTWSGINKLGGTGWIISTHISPTAPTTCDVKYVLDGTTDHDIPSSFVIQHVELERTSRRSRGQAGTTPPVKSNERGGERGSGSSGRGAARGGVHGCEDNVDDTVSRLTSDQTSGGGGGGKKRKLPSNTSTALTAKEPIVILTTAVDPQLMDQLTALCGRFSNVSVVTRFSSSVTHLVVSVDKQGVLKKRTMKYMQALVSGLWILSSSWVVESCKQGRLCGERQFEVAQNSKAAVDFAPRRARENCEKLWKQQQQLQLQNGSTSSASSSATPLFHLTSVLLFGQYPTPGPPRSDIEELLTKGGATVTAHLESFLQTCEDNEENKYEHKVIICTTLEFRDEFIDALSADMRGRVNVQTNNSGALLSTQTQDSLVFSPSPNNNPNNNNTQIPPLLLPRDRLRLSLLHVVSPLWALDSITNYQLMAPGDYEV